VGLFINHVFAKVTADEQKLIYQTDHAALLAACQQVIADPTAFGADKDGHMLGPWGGADAPNPKLPPAIRSLDFECINVDSKSNPPSMEILFGGGFYHYGLATSTAFRGGIKELIPGLWYWNEAGKLPPDPAKWRVPTMPALFVLSWLLLAGAVALLLWNRRRVHPVPAR
jgi:hypothetical protein